MSDIAIRVEGLSKRYHIQTMQDFQQGLRLRDVLTEGLERYGRKLLRPFGVRQAPRRDSEEFWALRDVSFEVNRGEVVGLVGRNGAGKSTLLKIISRITAPTGGRLRVRGRVVSMLEVGTGFNADLTGRENMYLNGAIIGMKRAEVTRKFDAIVSFAEVEQFIDTPVRFYSSGMYMRLAFAVAIHQDPDILLLDEVLTVGDHEFQLKCLDRMKRLTAEGHTVLFVSHSAEAVQQLCSRSIYLENGQLVAAGDTAQIIRRYMSRVSGVAA